MIYVDNQNTYDASTNIALETYLVENKLVDEPILLFYTNKPSIIIGRNQNTIEEINQPYIEKNGIEVVRRMSGGGAVYHDLGNVSFCFIKDDDGSFRDFASFTKPVIEALHKLGATGAELQGRNDLLIDGKKFSGNAMYAKDGRMTAHGTLLFNSDLEEVTNALKPRAEKIESKGIKSIRSRVTNIAPYVDEKYKNLSIDEFREVLLLEIFGVQSKDEVPQYILTDEDWEKVEQIKKERFGNWDWNYGASPSFDITKSKKFAFGLVDFRFNVAGGKVTSAKIYGDFFGLGDIKDVEDLLVGTKYQREAFEEVFKTIDVNKYFGRVTQEELIDLLFG